MTQIFVDHQTLGKIAGSVTDIHLVSDDYREFLESVRQQVEALNTNHRNIITMYYFEGRDIAEIALKISLPEDDIRRLLREALNKLRYVLAGPVEKRWPKHFKSLNDCPICGHAKRGLIEKIILNKKPGQSWGAINKVLLKKIGQSFNPPLILINHLKYHMKG